MNTTELRMSIIEKVMLLGDHALEKINTIAEQEVKQILLVPDSHYDEVERRWQAHLSGDGKTYSWEESKERILKAIKK